jgi:hypothetical protein
MIFLGLAVPGAMQLPPMEDLVAIWKVSKGNRFQNYRAAFTILDCNRLSRQWLEDIKAGLLVTKNAPMQWLRWIETGVSVPLRAERTVEYRDKNDQLLNKVNDQEMIKTIHKYFADEPVRFEACAVKLAQLMDSNFMSFDLTRPSRDGGRDAIGAYRVGKGESSIVVDCALEAKCYDVGNSVGVKEVSRLISRLRHRQFGVLVTTSYLNSQAYRELKEDGHPVIIISARDIVTILTQVGIGSVPDVTNWLLSEFPLTPSEQKVRELPACE